MPSRLFQLSTIALFLSQTLPAHATPFTPTRGDFGGIGLMQMPTGRMAAHGDFSFGASFNHDYQHYSTALQLMPWLEASIRYSRTPNRLYSDDPNFSSDNIYTDKGFDLKFRLLKEGFWLPETSLGLKDISGTGLFDSEYIAASKHIGPFDVTVGVGFGYIGNSGNLFGDKTSADCGREAGFSGQGGGLDYQRWFQGCAALFAGVEYQTPWQPLRIKLEYDGNDYTNEPFLLTAHRGIRQDTPINIGLTYQLKQWGQFQASYQRGNTLNLGFYLSTNFNNISQAWSEAPKASLAAQSKSIDEIDWFTLSKELERSAGYKASQIYASDQEITVVASQNNYRNRNIAYDRAAAQIISSGATAKKITFIEQSGNFELTQTSIDTEKYKEIAEQNIINEKLNDAITHEAVTPEKYIAGKPLLDPDNNKRLSYGISPTLQQSIGGSESFYLFNVGISGNADYKITNNLILSGSAYLNLFDNYDNFLYEIPSDGTNLIRVRTLVRKYVSDTRLALNNLQLTAIDKLSDNIYAQGYAGYLESMFAGGGAEILYRRQNSNWAIGLDTNYVIQRDPDDPFGLYKERLQFEPGNSRGFLVQTGGFTGHLTAYYRPNWEWLDGVNIKASAGRYLAEDTGVTLDISKQFDSGVIAGFFATKTNLSADQFGEGSFNKGLYLSIPFDTFTIKPTTSRALISWVPLTRDGGQKLNRQYSLYDLTNPLDPKSELTLSK
ncbi:MAG: YjbH domain-containing protein [Enterovibrio sp.]